MKATSRLLWQSGSGIIGRKSFPGYPGLNQTIAALETIVDLKNSETTAKQIWPSLQSNPNWDYAKTWVSSALSILVLFGLLEYTGKINGINLYRINSFTEVFVYLWRNNQEQAKNILRGTVIQLPWLREMLFFVTLHPEYNQEELVTGLEYLREGFDKESMRNILKLAIDLNLVQKKNGRYEITDTGKKFLWLKTAELRALKMT